MPAISSRKRLISELEEYACVTQALSLLDDWNDKKMKKESDSEANNALLLLAYYQHERYSVPRIHSQHLAFQVDAILFES